MDSTLNTNSIDNTDSAPNMASSVSAPPRKRHIIIVGGGIIGCTTAYFLTRHPSYDRTLHTITVLEASSIAAGASGKAGGLLATWAYPECLVPLSFRLHAELAAEHGGAERWGYRQVGCGSLTAVVTAGDLRRQELVRAAGTTTIPVPTTNGNGSSGEKKEQSSPGPTPLGLQLGVNGSNGNHTPATPELNAQPQALPIQSVNPPAAQNDNNPDEKGWEKLPKQSTTATSLLTDSPLPADLDWISPDLVTSYSQMGTNRTSDPETAQVHPFHFTTSMASLAAERGAKFHLKVKVLKINGSRHGINTVEYEDRNTGGERVMSLGDDVDTDVDVVVAAGPWTGRLLPKSKVEGLRAHSVVIEADVSPYAVFTDVALPADWAPEHRRAKGQRRKHRGNVDPEIYARPGGEVYACGEPDTTLPLPETADQVQTDEGQCDDLAAYIATISPQLAGAPVKTKQACYLPRHMRFGEERGPLIGRTGSPGLWVAAGHTCWGIQNGPATGCLMAEMLMGGEARSADIEVLDPRKFKV